MAEIFTTRRQLLLAGLESTYGVDAAPQHTNSFQAIRLMEPFALDLTQEMVDVTGGHLSRGAGRPIGTVRPAGVSFKAYVHGLDSGSYTANRRPPLGDLLRSCGLFETFSSSDAAGKPVFDYNFASDVGSDLSVTIVAHIDGFEHRLVGCRGNVNLVFGAAKPVIAEFTMRGQLTTEAATNRTGTVALPTQIPPRWVGSGTFFVESLAANVENLNFNTNNTVFEERASNASSGSGIIAVWLTQRQPGGSFDPEMTTPSSYDWFGAWRSSSGSVMRLQTGTGQGNRFTLTASQAVYRNGGWGDKEGMGIFNAEYQAAERNGQDEARLSFD